VPATDSCGNYTVSLGGDKKGSDDKKASEIFSQRNQVALLFSKKSL
jgi:hypothetical protein